MSEQELPVTPDSTTPQSSILPEKQSLLSKFNFFRSMNRTQTVSILILLALVIMLPLVSIIVKKQTQYKSRASGEDQPVTPLTPPDPTITPVPTSSPLPTDTPTPTPLPTNTPTPEPTTTPVPTQTPIPTPTPFPSISKIAPISGLVGSSVDIYGTTFSSPLTVRFSGSIVAQASIVSNTHVRAIVPADASSGRITVSTNGKLVASRQSFAVTPKISSIFPSSGHIGTTVTINGSGFAQTTSIKFGAITGYIGSRSSTRVTVTVPSGAKTGSIYLTTTGGTATSPSSFIVSN